MFNFAIYQNDTILNVIVADSKEAAEQATGMNAIKTEGSPWIGWVKQGDTWVNPQVVVEVQEVTE